MAVPSMRTLQACRSAVASFDPTSISGCKLWLDASDASSFTYSSGVVVSQWNDLSGTGNHVTQATSTKQPSRNGTQNSLTTVAFDGGDVLRCTVGTGIGVSVKDVTIISVFKKTGAAANDALPAMLAYNNQGFPLAGYLSYRYLIASFWTYSVVPIQTTTSWAVIASRAWVDGSDTKFHEYKDGASVEATSTFAGNAGTWSTANQRVAIAARDDEGLFFTGEIAEVLMYEALSDADRATVEGYLADKWGTP